MNRWSLTGSRRKARVALEGFLSLVSLALFLVFAVPAHAANRAVVARVPPVYPELAKRMKITGVVKIEVTVDAEGKVTAVKTLSGSKLLTPAAEEAVRKWKFEPGDGVATSEVEVNFQ